MRILVKVGLGFVGALVLLAGCCLVIVGPVGDYVLGVDEGLAPSFDRIEKGMSREKVVTLMGSPDSESTRFHLSQYEGFELEYAIAATSRAHYYLFWHQPIDVTFAVGFDEQDRVVVKAAGGT